MHRRSTHPWPIGLFLFALGTEAAAQVDPPSRVFLNGMPSPVTFNDGDSFRVLAGRHYNSRARLAGFNTLETFGHAHRWGGWNAKELYANAKLATLNARTGVWRCESPDLKRDGYGRILWWCKDLATDQVRRGLAHAMTVTLEPADPAVVAAQQQAIAERRGMWAHGVPEYILTSVHSTAEAYEGQTYNRLVSTRDGHSARWLHDEAYGDCEWVCSTERKVEEALIDAAVARLLADAAVAEAAEALSAVEFRNLVSDFARLGHFAGLKDPGRRATVASALDALEQQASFGDKPFETGSCHLYVQFLRRYGRGRMGCLDD